jgi:AAA15 family ATPase/GTPase
MSIVVKKGKEYRLKLPKFLCDYSLKDNVPPPFDRLVNGFRFVAITGNAGSGKTSLLVSLLLDRKILKKCYNNVVVVCPTSSRKSMRSDPFKDLDPSKTFESLEDIDKILEMLSFYSSEDETSLLVIDDNQSYLKDAHIANTLNHICANRRHLKTTIIILLQTYNKLPLSSRKLLNVLISFRPSKKEWVNIAEEALEFTPDQINKVFNLCFPHNDDDIHKHTWLMIDLQHQRLFKKFDEIIIADEDK